jgi:hypothetical protein
MSELALRKYLERYAEPEAAFARELGHQYGHVLVVPLQRESADFLQQLRPALEAATNAGRCLLIAVVNATTDAPDAVHEQNERLLAELEQRLVPQQELSSIAGATARAFLGNAGTFDVLVVDRASAGRRLAEGEGVGQARRIGNDIALGLHQLGGLTSPWLASTDADARLPLDYFARLGQVAPRAPDGTRRVALTLPFRHVPSGDEAVDRATQLYEISLRYYTLGLAAAGSPYAYESLGSTIVVLAPAYAEVRGFPRRQAGEDFYLLDKLAKVGSLHRPTLTPIELVSRPSDRVPFGTGARVRDIVASGGGLTTYHPRVFELLSLTLKALRHAVVTRNDAALLAELRAVLDAGTLGAISSALDELGTFEALRDTLAASPDPRVRERRLLTWFDALRTLRFIHLLEVPAGLPRLPVREAFAQAPFGAFWTADLPEFEVSFRAFSAEQALPSDIGLESLILAGVNGS